MTLPILVTGGTGTLGQQVVARLRAAGRDVRILSRRTGDGLVTGDLATGQGLPAAVQGAGTIVHCASNRTGDAQASPASHSRTWSISRSSASTGFRAGTSRPNSRPNA
jgi:uncharacterized protein YbjT (DUF2867 family)